MKGHTTQIRIPSLPVAPEETEEHPMYVQSKQLGASPTPPPSVTIPLDRVAEKDRVFDPGKGAKVRMVSDKALPVPTPSQPIVRKRA